MACKNKCGELTEEQKEVLSALATSPEPCGSKDIAAVTSLESKQVSCRITALKKKGYVASPARCKYEITEEGRKALK
jgi:predicted transcriptional regulator